ncbi:homoserine kinase [Flavobacterium branchiophilum]|uniref:Homoserine kinase n=1 Tax=Flavobacterium branchiophilum TaxID=55197 RepID=A0A543G8K8_9FLAO|nr:homoserine kinase [Flavobacterium branchiophilum]OXA81916.1 homoserine kinase [Flavobacterium branchiophilum] [Flavobacterium branchiophilum NBRC 15030 = ATCC 35035]TQM42304.1 homoserine kinase [Flavobacterium branchiophilum]GEM54731.1 homoserine kinase [Flavobacterium branchiophilum NBRC 15030 = ATCC 35035]
MNEIKIFCPATIANLSCGFDVLGLCLENIGDEMVIRKTTAKGIKISKIEGAQLPLETEKNVAGVAALAIYNAVDVAFGFEIEIYKKIKAGSGIGSSSASAAGAVFGINELLGRPFTKHQLVDFGMKGEAVASGSEHADNVAPCVLGGFTLVRGYNPLDVIRIDSPNELWATVIHPQIELKTSEMRAVLQPMISLKSAITQWGNVGGLIAGLYTSDYELISRSLHDVVVEPLRGKFIPNFEEVKKLSLDNGALGAGISGSGPSIFALSKGFDTAQKVAYGMQTIFEKTTIPFEIHVSKINAAGVTIIE